MSESLLAAKRRVTAAVPTRFFATYVEGVVASYCELRSDGHNAIEEMARAASERGYEYLAITDHSATFGFGDELSPTQRRFAVAETLSHLERLVREGRARRAGADGAVTYTA